MGACSPIALAYSRIFSRPTRYELISPSGGRIALWAIAPSDPSAQRERSPSSIVAEFEHGEERLLGDLDPTDLLHPPLALLLLLEQLPLAADVAAVALGRDVLAEGLDRLA